LIIILVGLIINSVNTKLLTFDKTKELCYQIYLLENTVIKSLNIKFKIYYKKKLYYQNLLIVIFIINIYIFLIYIYKFILKGIFISFWFYFCKNI